MLRLSFAVLLLVQVAACSDDNDGRRPERPPANPFAGFSSAIYADSGNWLCHPELVAPDKDAPASEAPQSPAETTAAPVTSDRANGDPLLRLREAVSARSAATEANALRAARPALAERLDEAPLGSDQQLATLDSKWCQLTATVNDSMELRGYLRSLGPLVEVRSPKKLRAAMRDDIEQLRALYA